MLLGSVATGIGSVPTAGGPSGTGSGPGTGDPLVVGKFSGTLVQQPTGLSLTYLSDTGEVGDTTINDGVPQNYPTSARTIEGLRVTSKSGTGGNALVVTLYKNNTPTAMTVTIPGSSPPVTLGEDFAHPITFADGDTYDLVASMTSGTGDGPYFLSATLEGGAAAGGGGGGGSVDSVTGAVPGIVDNTDPANPIITGDIIAAVVSVLNLSLSGPATVDGVALTTGQTCLASAQTNPTQNGPYTVDTTGAWPGAPLSQSLRRCSQGESQFACSAAHCTPARFGCSRRPAQSPSAPRRSRSSRCRARARWPGRRWRRRD